MTVEKTMFDLTSGDRVVRMEFTGLNARAQYSAIKEAVDNFYMDILDEIEKEKNIQSAEEKLKASYLSYIEPQEETAAAEEESTVAVKSPVKTNQTNQTNEKSNAMRELVDESGLTSSSYRVDNYGNFRFQAYYICENCRNKGKHYIAEGRVTVTCHECDKAMPVRKAIEEDFPHFDTFGNVYIAGDFLRDDEKTFSF